MTLLARAADYVYPPEHDAVILRALGLVLSGCVVLLWACLRLAPRTIGA